MSIQYLVSKWPVYRKYQIMEIQGQSIVLNQLYIHFRIFLMSFLKTDHIKFPPGNFKLLGLQ